MHISIRKLEKAVSLVEEGPLGEEQDRSLSPCSVYHRTKTREAAFSQHRGSREVEWNGDGRGCSLRRGWVAKSRRRGSVGRIACYIVGLRHHLTQDAGGEMR